MLDKRGPPKKRKKASVPTETSIVPAATTSSAPTMFYPQRQQTRTGSKKGKQTNIASVGLVRSVLGTGSNQPESIHVVIPPPAPEESTPPLVVDKQKPKAKPNKKEN